MLVNFFTAKGLQRQFQADCKSEKILLSQIKALAESKYQSFKERNIEKTWNQILTEDFVSMTVGWT